MAVTAVATSMAGAINYTFITDTSADFASVANSTYFYNKADKLVRFKDSTGAVLEIFSASGGASGIFGISNSSGVYTYYATLTLAMAAAVSGNTIVMFANFTETGAVTITLKNGVDINGNGYTYTLNNTGGNNAFVVPDSIVTSCKIINITIVRSGNTGTTAYCLTTGTNSSGVIDFSGSTLRNTGGSAALNIVSTYEINNLTAFGVAGGAIKIGTSNAGTRLSYSIGYATGGGVGIATQNGGDLYYCSGYSDSGYGIYSNGGTSINCLGVSVSGGGMVNNNFAYNCVGRSNTGVGFECTSATVVTNCSGTSGSGIGFRAGSSSITNCYGYSSSSFGVVLTSNVYSANITSYSAAAPSMWALNASVRISGGNVYSDWNNAAAYGIRGNGGSIADTIINCSIRLVNATAPYLFNDAIAATISMRGNTYRGGAAFAANITQLITATEDNQGNIYL